jgi:preprotein translocase subunit YajC
MPTQQAGPLMTLYSFFPLVIIFVIFYFLLIRPQKQQEKEHQKMLAALAKNDEVITTGGIHGTIVNVKDKSVIIRVDDNVKIEVEKNCIAHKTKIEKAA